MSIDFLDSSFQHVHFVKIQTSGGGHKPMKNAIGPAQPNEKCTKLLDCWFLSGQSFKKYFSRLKFSFRAG